MSTRWSLENFRAPKLRSFYDSVSINNSSWSNDMSFILECECMVVTKRTVFSRSENFLWYFWLVGRSMRCCRCSWLLILQHATTFSHSHFLNTHCNRFFNVYNSHLAYRTSSSLPFHTIFVSKSMHVAPSSHICTIIKMPQLLQLPVLL